MSDLNIPSNLKYTKEHEWIRVQGDTAEIGITDFAQSSLGDIVFVELPEVGSHLEKDTSFGVVESIKSVSDLYAPVSGEVLETNESIVETPEQCNQAPYDSWMLKIKIAEPGQLSSLLDAQKYRELCENE